MRVRILLLVLVAIGLGALVPSADAQLDSFLVDPHGWPLTETQVNGYVTGQLVVAFHGDQATGCVPRGLCGERGVTVWTPHQQAEGTSFTVVTGGGGTRVLPNVMLGVSGEPGDVRTMVQRDTGLDAFASCADASDGTASATEAVSGARVTLRVLAADTSVLATRCAGPRDADLADTLPAIRIPLQALIHGHRRFSLAATRTFAAGGFSGTIRSTLVLHLGDANSDRFPSPPRRGQPRERIVRQGLTVQGVSGALTVSTSSPHSGELCSTLDSCGLRGEITIAPGPAVIGGSLAAVGPARRPYRDFLAALGLSRRGNPRGIAAYGEILLRGGQMTEDFGRCRDTGRAGFSFVEFEAEHGTMQGALYVLELGTLRCGGPLLSVGNPLSGTPLTASGSISRQVFSHSSFGLTFVAHSPFSDDSYVGLTHGSLTVRLRRGHVRQAITAS